MKKYQRGKTSLIGGIVVFLIFAVIYLVGPSQWDAFQMKDILKDVGWKWQRTLDVSLAKQDWALGCEAKYLT